MVSSCVCAVFASGGKGPFPAPDTLPGAVEGPSRVAYLAARTETETETETVQAEAATATTTAAQTAAEGSTMSVVEQVVWKGSASVVAGLPAPDEEPEAFWEGIQAAVAALEEIAATDEALASAEAKALCVALLERLHEGFYRLWCEAQRLRAEAAQAASAEAQAERQDDASDDSTAPLPLE
jgi:hypothetical protein